MSTEISPIAREIVAAIDRSVGAKLDLILAKVADIERRLDTVTTAGETAEIRAQVLGMRRQLDGMAVWIDKLSKGPQD
jgi:hypothetical protein